LIAGKNFLCEVNIPCLYWYKSRIFSTNYILLRESSPTGYMKWKITVVVLKKSMLINWGKQLERKVNLLIFVAMYIMINYFANVEKHKDGHRKTFVICGMILWLISLV